MFDTIFSGRKIIFIAEIGLNHNGKLETAEEMIEKASLAGADAVKFQTFVPEMMNSPLTSSLMKGDSEPVEDYSITEFFRSFTFTPDEWRRIKKKSEECGLIFFSAPFDIPSVGLLENLGVPLYKVASSEVTNIPLLKRIAGTGKPVILSTGMTREPEIQTAIRVLESSSCGEIILLHCVSLYPADDSEANLKRILTLKEKFGKPVGISDHSRDFSAVMIAAAMGATVVEKHFKLTGDHDCPDRDVSLTPEQFSEMVHAAERGFLMGGDGSIDFSGRESQTAAGARRSLFASRDIPVGSILTGEEIICLRPGTGIPASQFYNYTGRKTKTDIRKGSPLRPEYFI